MGRILSYIFLCCFMLAIPAAGSAQQVKIKNYREARNLLKNNKKGDVEKIVGKLAPADSVEKSYLNGMLQQYAFEKENVNMYYGNKVDTARVFNTLYAMYENFGAAYSQICKHDTYAKPVQTVFKQYQNNLRIGGNYFVTHQNYDEAFKFYSLFIRLNEEKLIAPTDSVLANVFGNVVVSASLSNRLDETVRLAGQAHAAGVCTEGIDLQLCDALRKMNRMEEWEEALIEAVKHHPDQFVFYGMLIDYFLTKDRTSEAMELADNLIKKDEGNYLNCFVKGYVFQRTQEYEQAIVWLKKAVEKNAQYVPALISLGFCTVEKAEAMEGAITHFPFTAEEKKEIQDIYQEAKTYLEKAQELAPQDKAQWGNALWKVYYKLNDGRKLEEIEKIL